MGILSCFRRLEFGGEMYLYNTMRTTCLGGISCMYRGKMIDGEREVFPRFPRF